MSVALTATTLVLSLALLWATVRRLPFGTPVSAALSAVDILALVLTVVSLGWLGIGLFMAANALGFVIWGVVHAAKIDEELTYAAIQADVPQASVKAAYHWLGKQRELRAMGPRRRAMLVRLLCERARSPDEVRDMALPIGMLWLTHKPDLAWLVEQFDAALRVYGEPASASMRLADVLTVGTQQSAANFEQMLEALVVAGGGAAQPLAHAAATS
jgi:hypothetical protein